MWLLPFLEVSVLGQEDIWELYFFNNFIFLFISNTERTGASGRAANFAPRPQGDGILSHFDDASLIVLMCGRNLLLYSMDYGSAFKTNH